MNDTVVAIVSAFFIIGIVMGIIAVVAMSLLRADRRREPGDPADPDYHPRRPGGQPADPRWGADRDEDSRWPGGTDNDFSGS